MSLAKKPFVVLDAEILSSSVWSESASVRLVWITLLILCDTEGYVGASLPGIARAAGVTMEEATQALERFQQPDVHSRTQANEGRRLAPAERGYQILNFIDHLNRLSSERTKARDRMRRHRERKSQATVSDAKSRLVTPVTSHVPQGIGNREQGVGKRDKRTTTDLQPAAADSFPSKFAVDVYRRHYPTGTPPAPMFKALRPLVLKYGWPMVEPELDSYLSQTETAFQSWPKFANGFGTWAHGKAKNVNGAPKRTEKQVQSLTRQFILAKGRLPSDSERAVLASGNGQAGAVAFEGGNGGAGSAPGASVQGGTPALPDGPRMEVRRE